MREGEVAEEFREEWGFIQPRIGDAPVGEQALERGEGGERDRTRSARRLGSKEGRDEYICAILSHHKGGRGGMGSVALA